MTFLSVVWEDIILGGCLLVLLADSKFRAQFNGGEYIFAKNIALFKNRLPADDVIQMVRHL